MTIIRDGLPWPTRAPKQRGSWRWHLSQLQDAQCALPDPAYEPEQFPLPPFVATPEADDLLEQYSERRLWPDSISEPLLRELDQRFLYAVTVYRARVRERILQPQETWTELFRWALIENWRASGAVWVEATNHAWRDRGSSASSGA